MPYFPSPPPIPSQILVSVTRDEHPFVIAAIVNIMLRWIDRARVEKPLEANLALWSGLSSKEWKEHETRVKTLLESIYEPFMDKWLKHSHKVDRLKKIAKRSANKWTKLNDMLKKHFTEVTETTLKDSVEAFSHQPHTLNRGFRGNTLAPAASSQVVATKPASNKPRLKDQE